jgi:hypothetical protein
MCERDRNKASFINNKGTKKTDNQPRFTEKGNEVMMVP